MRFVAVIRRAPKKSDGFGVGCAWLVFVCVCACLLSSTRTSIRRRRDSVGESAPLLGL